MTGSAQIIQADARNLPLADDSVDLIVTSPPYFALRSYQDGGEHYSGQIGSEATPAEFLDALLDVTRECVRVLKPSGSLWINLGDKYAAGHGGSSTEGKGVNSNVGHKPANNFRERDDLPNPPASWGKRDASGGGIVPGFRPKTLMGMPWRYAIRCIDDLGLILRAEVVWSKPNGLPESVTDRVRRSHEQWFHFTLQPRYFSAVDEIREKYSDRVHDRQKYAGRDIPRGKWSEESGRNDGNGERGILGFGHQGANPLGKLPGSVWTIPTEPLQVPDHLGVDHFAAFPTEWPRRIIQGWSPSGVCVGCGEGRRPITRTDRVVTQHGITPIHKSADNNRSIEADYDRKATLATITGYTCACDGDGFRSAQGLPLPATRPAVVLDPFGGTGTTALVAKALGRHGISVDMSADYCRLAQWRVDDPAQLAKAARVEKPPRQVDGQIGFDLEGIA